MTRMHQMTARLPLLAPLAALLFSACSASSGEPLEANGQLSLALLDVPSLGAASSFALLGSSTVTCANSSAITGDVGVSPGIAITGFDESCTLSAGLHAVDALATRAHEDLAIAFDDLASRSCDENLTGQELGGQTLPPGVYCFDTTAGITGELTLDGGGDPDAAWIFQVGSALITASGSSIAMAGGGSPCNVFWKVGTSATLGTSSAFTGNILASASITLTSASSLNGRALALNAAVTSDNNAVSLGTCSQ
jgi:ice-binding like protein